MKQVIAIVKPFVAERLLNTLIQHGHTDITIQEVKGYGRQKSYLSEYQENEYSVVFLPKVEICVWTGDGQSDEVARLMVQNARTGRMGDGKVFCLNVISQTETF